MPSDDFKMVDRIFGRILDKKEKDGIEALAPEERVVLLIWHATGIIGNGGFQYFYEQELDAEAVACAFDKIGSRKCAEMLRHSLSLFPDSLRQASWNRRIEYIKSKSELFYRLSSQFWDAETDTEKKLANYVRSNFRNSLE